jgi:hypothetical protein
MFLLGAILPVVMIFLVHFVMPETPRWLLVNERETEAREILIKVYPDGNSCSLHIHTVPCCQTHTIFDTRFQVIMWIRLWTTLKKRFNAIPKPRRR